MDGGSDEARSQKQTRGFGRLKECINRHADDYEVIAQQRDVDAHTLDRALEIVKQFIIDQSLILYGGLAIDYALRLKGDRIYPDKERPDYDFYSPENVHDAYKLAEIFAKEGFENVGAIRALHVQTMRVKINFLFVADLSYMPLSIFETIPTIVYQHMKVVHPDYQRAHMHLAFCFPFNNPPLEDVFHRYAKDLERFRLFQNHYPFDPQNPNWKLNMPVEGGRPSVAVKFHLPVDPSRVAIHGFVAYSLLREAYSHLAKAAKELGINSSAATLTAPKLEITIKQDKEGLSIIYVPPSQWYPSASFILSTSTFASPEPVPSSEVPCML